MNLMRLLIIFAVALVGVIAQNVYLNRLTDLFKKVNDFTQKLPALKGCVEGIPLDVDSWIKMDIPTRKAKIGQLAAQTKATMDPLIRDPKMDGKMLLDFDDAVLAMATAIVDASNDNQLTATPSTTAPAPTTAAPAPTTEKSKETTEAPKSTEAPAASQKPESANSTASAASGSGNTDIETVSAEPVAATTAPKAAASTAPEATKTSAGVTLGVVAPALVATVFAAFIAM